MQDRFLEQLNKKEKQGIHYVATYFYGKKRAKLYQTYIDGMEEQLTALSIVTNAIIYWNTLYLERVIDQMRVEGFDCSEEKNQ